MVNGLPSGYFLTRGPGLDPAAPELKSTSFDECEVTSLSPLKKMVSGTVQMRRGSKRAGACMERVPNHLAQKKKGTATASTNLHI